LGFAESDPSLDVHGYDTRSKLKILMRLAYGFDVKVQDISCIGIEKLQKVDFEYSKRLGGTIKLIAMAKVFDTQYSTVYLKKIRGFVTPCFIKYSDRLSRINDALNEIEIKSKKLQIATYIGEGAGWYPTANSCVNDTVSITKGEKNMNPFPPKFNCNTLFVPEYEYSFYIPLSYENQCNDLKKICTSLFEGCDIIIDTALEYQDLTSNNFINEKNRINVNGSEKIPLYLLQIGCVTR